MLYQNPVQTNDHGVPFDVASSDYAAFACMVRTATGRDFDQAMLALEDSYEALVRAPSTSPREIITKAKLLLHRQVECSPVPPPTLPQSERLDLEMLASIIEDLERLAKAPLSRAKATKKRL